MQYRNAVSVAIVFVAEILLLTIAGIWAALSVTSAIVPALLIIVAAALGSWVLAEYMVTVYLRNRRNLEPVSDSSGAALQMSRKARAFDSSMAIVLLGLATVSVLLAVAWIGLHARGWQGHHGVSRIAAGQVVEVGASGSRVRIPEGWYGTALSLWRLPAWMGFTPEDDDAPRHTLLVRPLGSGEGELFVDYGRDNSDWSDLKITNRLNTVTPDAALRRAGVRAIFLKPPPIDPVGNSMDAFLFVDDPGGRYLVSVRLSVDDERKPSAPDVVSALKAAGFEFTTR